MILQVGIGFVAGVLFGCSMLYLIQYLKYQKNKAQIWREMILYYNSLIKKVSDESNENQIR